MATRNVLDAEEPSIDCKKGDTVCKSYMEVDPDKIGVVVISPGGIACNNEKCILIEKGGKCEYFDSGSI